MDSDQSRYMTLAFSSNFSIKQTLETVAFVRPYTLIPDLSTALSGLGWPQNKDTDRDV